MVDRLLLNRWVSRAGNFAFLASAVLFVKSLVSGWKPESVLVVALLIVGVLLMAAPRVERWRLRSRSVELDVDVKFFQPFLVHIDKDTDGHRSLLRYTTPNVTITNQTDVTMSLRFQLLVAVTENAAGLTEVFVPYSSLFHGDQRQLPDPLEVPPRKTVVGTLVFSLWPISITENKLGGKFESFGKLEKGKGFAMRVCVTDLASKPQRTAVFPTHSLEWSYP
jgi:hypothetical protein